MDRESARGGLDLEGGHPAHAHLSGLGVAAGERAGEQPERPVSREVADDAHVQEPVVEPGVGREQEPPAHRVAVADRAQEQRPVVAQPFGQLGPLPQPTEADGDGRAAPLPQRAEYGRHVGLAPADPLGLGREGGGVGVEPGPEPIRKVALVLAPVVGPPHAPHVHRARRGRCDLAGRLAEVLRHPERERIVVAGPHWQHAQHPAHPNGPIHGFVDGPVSARYDHGLPRIGEPVGEVAGVARPRRPVDLGADARLRQRGRDGRDEPGGAAVPSGGVEDYVSQIQRAVGRG